MRWFVLAFILSIKVVSAGTYTIDLSGGGSLGAYSGLSVSLNQMPFINQALGPGTLRFATAPSNAFVLNSQGKSFQVINFLRIDNSGSNWLIGPTVLSSITAITTSTSTGNIFINENLAPGINLTKTINSGLEVRLVDNSLENNSITPGQSFTIETKYMLGPQNEGPFSNVVMNYEVSNISGLSQLNPSLVAGFRIEDLNGNAVSYLSVIPEPSALPLLAVGLGGLAMLRRRRS